MLNHLIFEYFWSFKDITAQPVILVNQHTKSKTSQSTLLWPWASFKDCQPKHSNPSQHTNLPQTKPKPINPKVYSNPSKSHTPHPKTIPQTLHPKPPKPSHRSLPLLSLPGRATALGSAKRSSSARKICASRSPTAWLRGDLLGAQDIDHGYNKVKQDITGYSYSQSGAI